ncbi:MAG: DUF3108 domain-containing protein [Planctomycetota bacterium]
MGNQPAINRTATAFAMAAALSSVIASAQIAPADLSSSAPSLSSTNASSVVLSISPSYVPYQPLLQNGETLNYALSVNGLSVGRCVMTASGPRTIGADTPVFDVKTQIRTSRMANSVNAKLRADIASQIDGVSGFSRLYTLDATETKRRKKRRIEHRIEQQATHYVFLDGVTDTDNKPRLGSKIVTGRVGQVSAGLLDPLSAMYYLRSISFDGIDSITLPVASDNNVWFVRLTVVERSKVMYRGVSRPATIVEVKTYCEGPIARKGRLRITLDDETGVALVFEMDVPSGRGRAVLTETHSSPLN